MEKRGPQTEAPGFAEHLEETAAEEVNLQFLERPFSPSAEVSEALGHDQWRIMRRFVIEQGSKLRPVDDGLDAGLARPLTRPKRTNNFQSCPAIVAIGTWQSLSSETGMEGRDTTSLTP